MSGQFNRDRSGFITFIFFISIILIFIATFQTPVSAEMKRLSEIQDGLFHINPESMVFTAKTFVNDRFIDIDQSNDFIWASASEPFLPADKNYEFSVIDNFTLYSDLVILRKYNSILCCPYPAKAYLSRDNILLSDYTNQSSPLKVYMHAITGYEPFHNEKVKAIYWKLNNFELTQNESIHRSKGGVGYLSDAYVNVISAYAVAWVGNTYPPLNCEEEPVYCLTCLPKSDWPKPKQPIYLIRISSTNPCIGEPIWPEPPHKSCIIGPPLPERTTPAATNWSYNFHLNANSTDSDDRPSNNNSSSNYNFTNSNYCPTCK